MLIKYISQIFIEWDLLHTLYQTHFYSWDIFCLLKSTWWKLTVSNEMFNIWQVGKCDCVLLSNSCLLLRSVSFCISKTVFSFIFHCIPELRLLRLKATPPPLNILIVKHYEHKQILPVKNRGIRWISLPKMDFPNFFADGYRLKNQEQIKKFRSSYQKRINP